jgi:hypothetical protein
MNCSQQLHFTQKHAWWCRCYQTAKGSETPCTIALKSVLLLNMDTVLLDSKLSEVQRDLVVLRLIYNPSYRRIIKALPCHLLFLVSATP